MEEIYYSVLRVILGIVTLIGLLWGALQYLIKYMSFKTQYHMKVYTDAKVYHTLGKIDEVTKRVDALEEKIGKK